MSSYFASLYCLLDLSCGECPAISLYILCCSVNGSVCQFGGQVYPLNGPLNVLLLPG